MKKIGKIKNLKLNKNTQELELTILITDSIFKRTILRNLSLSGKLTIEEDHLVLISKE